MARLERPRAAAPTPGGSRAPTGPDAGDDWWRRGVIYQVYPRSFADSTGDGVGDLPGLTAHLDHLGAGGLGVDAVWLSPIYPSPGRDLGYDVADHETVDPLFGTDADFDAFIEAAHRRGIRVLLDLVMNHTSDQHRWFQESRHHPDGPFGDWYLWRDASGVDRRGKPKPPNNWVSWFGGSGWTWDEVRGQFYFHTFLPEQPDLNWRNPDVPEAQLTMVRKWLARGVDGFRLDVFNTFFKHAGLPGNPAAGKHRQAWFRQQHLYDQNQPELLEFLTRFRAEVDREPGRMTVGELFGGGAESAASYATDRHLVFDFVLLEQPWRAGAFAAAIDRIEAAFGPGRWPALVLSNHDQPRTSSRLSKRLGEEDRDAVAKAAALILLTLRGTPFLYYGEEIGLGNIEIPNEEAIDPPAHLARWSFPWWNRDGCRSPMPWTGEANGGFTAAGARPWLPLVPDAASRNVAAQDSDPDSVLATYRRLLAARRTTEALRSGSMRRLESGHRYVLAWERQSGRERALVLVNFSTRPARVRLPDEVAGRRWEAAVGTERDAGGPVGTDGRLTLRPLEGRVLTSRG